MVDSVVPMATATASIRARWAPATRSLGEPAPKGLSSEARSALPTASFIAAPYSIAARSGPLWSRIITSWTMVSSRCVVGSSTGMRADSTWSSTVRAMVHPTRTTTIAGSAPWKASICEKLVAPVMVARVPSERKSAGSTSAEKVASRLAPMPSKALPVSRAPSIRAMRPRPQR